MSRRFYSIQRFRGEYAIVTYAGNKRHRHKLGTADKAEAERLAPAFYAELNRPLGKSVAELWVAYNAAKVGLPILASRKTTWKALEARFGPMPGDAITVEDCEAHIAERRKAGRKDGTVYTELSHLRTTLVWAFKKGLITKAPHIERPPQPGPKEDYLTRAQAKSLIETAQFPHIKLFIVLALGTGARTAALLGLTWDRCDFKAKMIDLRDATLARPHKGRAVVPMNNMVERELRAAQKIAKTPFVIEWDGARVASVKKSLKNAARAAGVGAVSPHMLRHSAAVHMAEAGIPMEEIAQYLGHVNSNTTERVYARYSPEYLRQAARALEYGDAQSAEGAVVAGELAE